MWKNKDNRQQTIQINDIRITPIHLNCRFYFMAGAAQKYVFIAYKITLTGNTQ